MSANEGRKDDEGESEKASIDAGNTKSARSTDSKSKDGRDDNDDASNERGVEREETHGDSNRAASGEQRNSPHHRPRRSSGSSSSVRRKAKQGSGKKVPVDAPVERRPSLNGIFADSEEDGDDDDIFRSNMKLARAYSDSDGDATSPAGAPPGSPRERQRRSREKNPDSGPRRRHSSGGGSRSEVTPSPRRGGGVREGSSRRERRRSSGLEHTDEEKGAIRSRHRKRAPVGAQSLGQTRHAARSLVPMGAGHHSRVRKARTCAEIKELGRVREWASFCRRRTYLSLDDLSREERPRTAKKGGITPFSLHLMKVEGWQIPQVLVDRTDVPGHGLRFSLSVSFYHAGSKRFYGDTFMGDGLDEGDKARVEVITEKWRGFSKAGKSKEQRSNRSQKANAGRRSKGNRGRRAGGRENPRGEDDVKEVEVMTRHEELVYWYTHFEDPNCLAVVELVATVMDNNNRIQVGQYGCGWTFIQFFGPNEPEAMQHRDVYRGSPRSLLFFEQGDWGSVGETAIPGCSLAFTLSIWENLTRAKHLFRPDEIVSATDMLPGMQFKTIDVPDRPKKVGPFLGLRIEESSTRPSRRGKTGRDNSGDGGRWTVEPSRPRLAPCLEFRLSSLRVVIPGRESYERDLIRSLGEDVPDQEIIKTTTQQHALGFSRTQREVITSLSQDAEGRGTKSGGGAQRAKIVDRRAKIGFHNGHTLVLPDEWVETHLEETDDSDVLMLPEEMSSLNVDGFVPHPLFALVVLVEYTIRTRAKNADSRLSKREAGGRGKKGDPLSQVQAELNHAALPVVVGMQVFVPHDGKRLRLRNTSRDGDSMNIGLRLSADRRVRLVTTELVYTNKKHLSDEAHGGSSDDEDGRGPKMIYFDLKAYDSRGKALVDETPASGDESPLEASGWEKPKAVTAESSGDVTPSTEESSSTESSTETSQTEAEEEESDAHPMTPPKPQKVAKPKPKKKPSRKAKRKRPPIEPPSSDSDSTNMSLVTGDSEASSLRLPPPRKKRHAHVQATDKDWDAWRNGIKVPRRSESLMGQTLQAPLHAEASAQTVSLPESEPAIGLYGPDAVVVGGFAPLAQELSRASRTRLSRHGFTDVMKDTVDSSSRASGHRQARDDNQVAIDLELEASDPLAKHEVTLQFAAFRASTATCENMGGGGNFDESKSGRVCDRMAEGGGSSQLHILVREGRYGRDEPSLGLCHSIDTTFMQPFEAHSFASYMAGTTLFVDLWDGDALMHLGTLALPLRTLMRQQQGVVKTAMEYEVVASMGGAEDCGSGGGIAVRHGHLSKGPVVGLVQILASNYGEPGKGGDLPASGAVPAIVHPLATGPNIRGDWRMGSGPGDAASALARKKTRPRLKVRARPLSETNPELSKYMEAVAGPDATGGAIASLARPGRGDVDADSMGYDELMLLVRRFRGSVKGRVWYAGPLLRLLDVPGLKRLQQRLIRAIERAERGGLSLVGALREMDTRGTGEISTHDLEEMFWGMLGPRELSREHLTTVVKSMDPGGTGKVGLRELITFVRARQAGGGGRSGAKEAEAGLLRALARAELGGLSVDETFCSLDPEGKDSLSHAHFWEAVHKIGGLPGVVKASLDPLLRRFDIVGDGRVSLPALMEWAGRTYLSTAAVENALRKKVLTAEALASSKGGGDSLEKILVGAGDLSSSLKALPNLRLTLREMACMSRRLEVARGGGPDTAAFLLFFGRRRPRQVVLTPVVTSTADTAIPEEAPARDAVDGDEEDSNVAVEFKLKRILWKAESMGISLAEAFGVFDKNGSGFITVSELEEGLRTLGVFKYIPQEKVRELVHKLKRISGPAQSSAAESEDQELLVSAEEFVQFVGGGYDATEAAEGRLRRLLALAEEQEGVSLQGAFGALDKSKTGKIPLSDLKKGLRELGIFEGMSSQQAVLATKRFDSDGDGNVSLPEFLAFAGKPYAANDRPLETKLRRVLQKAESMGTSMEDAFKHFDKNGSGFITTEGFSTGLQEMGIFPEFSREEVEQVVASFGGNDAGGVSLPKFLCFLGKEYGRSGERGRETRSSLAGRLRLILTKAQELGTPLSASFQGFGADEDGRLSAHSLHEALRDIGQFRWTTLGEVNSFVRLLQHDPEGEGDATDSEPSRGRQFLTLPALQAFVDGGDEYVAQREREYEERRTQHRRRKSSKRIDGEKATAGVSGSKPLKAVGRLDIARASSWSDGGDDTTNGDDAQPGVVESEQDILRSLQVTLGRVARATGGTAEEGEGRSRHLGDGIEGHLGSFDLDDDGRLSPVEFGAALRSLGSRGSEFGGRKGMAALVSRFGDGNTGGASIVEVVRWFAERVRKGGNMGEGEIGNGKTTQVLTGSRNNDDGKDAGRRGKWGQSASAREMSADASAGQVLRRAVRIAESKGTTLERTFARLDDDGDGFITLRQLLRGLDQMGVFQQATRDDVLDALDVLDEDSQPRRPAHRVEEGKEESESDHHHGSGVDLVSFIRLMRQKPTRRREHTPDDDRASSGDHPLEEPPYDFSVDPETRAAEKRLRRVVAKQARQGVDVEGVFRRYDPEESGSVLRSDFIQAVMQLGVSVLDTIAPRNGSQVPYGANEADPMRRRQLSQLARAKGPVERRLLRMRQRRRGLFDRSAGTISGAASKAEVKDGEAGGEFVDGDESLALIQWYREGQKKSMVRHILATSLTTEYNLFFAFASPLFFEHPLRNPFNHEERFRIDVNDHQLRVVTGTAEWRHLRRNVPPCVGDIGDGAIESEFLDIDPQQGIQVTLMAHEVVFIPFVFLCLDPRGLSHQKESARKRTSSDRGSATVFGEKSFVTSEESGSGPGTAERSVAVAFVSASHGHVVSVMQVHLQRRAFVVNRTFRFHQNEGEVLKRSIRLLPGAHTHSNIARGPEHRYRLESSNEASSLMADRGAKYMHCVEDLSSESGGDTKAGGVVIEWARRPAYGVGSGFGGMGDVQEVLLKCRVGAFPSQKGFYLLVYNDHYQSSLYETWYIVVHARLRMDVHSLLGQQSPADLVVRGDRYSRKVRAFSSSPTEVSFEPQTAFQLVPGAYNRVQMQFRPLSLGSRKIHVHIVDVDSMEIVGAWLATATAMPPVVTKSYDVDLPVGRPCHKRIAYANPWSATRLFRLSSSDSTTLRPRYESLEIAGGGTGYLRLWFAPPGGSTARKEAFLFVNDREGQNEECLLIRMRGV